MASELLLDSRWRHTSLSKMAAMTERRIRIALYSHDTMGLGHMSRNLLLAEELAASWHRPSVLLISGSREIGRFGIPRGTDVLSLPALYKDAASTYHARSLDVPLSELVALRSATILGALDAFAPDVFIVDNVPRGAQGELDAALRHLRAIGRTRCVLGLRDILDDAAHVRSEWARAANFSAVQRYFDAVWVYGDQDVTDVATEYGFPENVRRRIRYTGYLDQRVRGGAIGRSAFPVSQRDTVLCLLGGGQDGIGLAESFAKAPLPEPLRGLLVTGPMMSQSDRRRVEFASAGRERFQTVEFLDKPAAAMCDAHAVITMGGYNTVCDVLSYAPRALLVPRVRPRSEQLIRATRLAARGLLEVLHPDAATPEALAAWASSPAPLPATGAVRMHTTAGLHALLDEVLTMSPARRRPMPALEVLYAS